MAEGVALLKAQRIDEASARFDDAVHRDPTLASAHYYLGTGLRAAQGSRRRGARIPAHDRARAVDGSRTRSTGIRPRPAGAHRGRDRLVRTRDHAGSDPVRRAVSPGRHALVDETSAIWPDPALEAAVRARSAAKAEARYYLGLTLRQLGDLDGAIGQLRESTRLAPTARHCARISRDRASRIRRSRWCGCGAAGGAPPRRRAR